LVYYAAVRCKRYQEPGRGGIGMIRRAFTLQLKPGALAEYKEKHDNIWPELVEEIRRLGIAEMTAFEADPVIFYYSEILDEEAWDRLWASPVHDRWAELFKELIAFNDSEQVDAAFMPEIFHLQTVPR
jgi:L-rhamnose mutarotase